MIKRILPIVLFFLSLLCFGVSWVKAVNLTENFNDGNYDGWTEYPSTDNSNLCSNSWSVVDGKLNAKINQYGCSTNLYPSNHLWNDIGLQYEINLDMWMVSGVDHNFAIRFDPTYIPTVQMPANYYEYHFSSPNKISLGGGPPALVIGSDNPNPIFYNIPNRIDPYHIRIVYRINRLELYIDGQFVHKRDIAVSSIWNYLITGRVAIRAGSGASLSETHFDNIRVTSLEHPDPPEPTIDVPYFSQTDPEWGEEPYDSTSSSIGQLGCALTATAMVLKYHGLTQIPDGQNNLVPLTPLTLNQWLVDHDAFAKNGDLLFPSVAKLSKDLVTQLKSEGESFDFDTLEYNKLRAFEVSTDDFVRIDRYLSHYFHPLIFKEKSTISPSGNHFIVATKVIETAREYGVVDPISETRTSTEFPPDVLRKVIYFRPANSDLSYIQFQSDADISMRVQTPVGMVTEAESAIDSADISYEEPIAAETDPTIFSGNPMWEFDYKYPPGGEYFLYLKSESDGFIVPWLFFYDIAGGDKAFKQRFFTGKNFDLKLKINYNNNNSAETTVERVVDFPTLLSDLKALNRLGWIKQKGLYSSLNSLLVTSRPFHDLGWKGFEKMGQMAINKIEKLTDGQITPEAKEVILYDLNYLLDHSYAPLHRLSPTGEHFL